MRRRKRGGDDGGGEEEEGGQESGGWEVVKAPKEKNAAKHLGAVSTLTPLSSELGTQTKRHVQNQHLAFSLEQPISGRFQVQVL